MKIDFHGHFPEIRRLLDAKRSQEANKAEFGKLLSDINPNNPKPLESQQVKTPSGGAPPALKEPEAPMASFRFSEPEMSLPELVRQVPSQPAVEEAPIKDVKSPTLLGVTRRTDTVPESLSSLPQNDRISQVREMVDQAGFQHGIDPVLGMAVASAESSFNPQAVSQDGHYSKGLFQLLDSTADTVIDRAGLNPQYDLFNPEQNVDLGVRYLRYLHEVFSQDTTLSNKYQTKMAANSAELEKLAVAAFNAGEGRVASAQQRALAAGGDPSQYQVVMPYLPRITQEYVDRVMERKGQFE